MRDSHLTISHNCEPNCFYLAYDRVKTFREYWYQISDSSLLRGGKLRFLNHESVTRHLPFMGRKTIFLEPVEGDRESDRSVNLIPAPARVVIWEYASGGEMSANLRYPLPVEVPPLLALFIHAYRARVVTVEKPSPPHTCV